MDLIGTLKAKFDTQVVSEKFSKREFVLITEENTPYPQEIIFQLTQQKCELLNTLQPNDQLKVHFGIRGRMWGGPQGTKYFNTLEAWRIEKITGATVTSTVNATATASTVAPEKTIQVDNPPPPADDNDDLPF